MTTQAALLGPTHGDTIFRAATLNGFHSVGWYGVPGGRPGGLVHIHRTGVGPVCGVRLHPDAEYQWCSDTNLRYVECERCKAKARHEAGATGKRVFL